MGSTTRARSCDGKQRHDKASAQRHLGALKARGAVGYHSYRCTFCSQHGKPAVYHVGHRTGRNRRRR